MSTKSKNQSNKVKHALSRKDKRVSPSTARRRKKAAERPPRVRTIRPKVHAFDASEARAGFRRELAVKLDSGEITGEDARRLAEEFDRQLKQPGRRFAPTVKVEGDPSIDRLLGPAEAAHPTRKVGDSVARLTGFDRRGNPVYEVCLLDRSIRRTHEGGGMIEAGRGVAHPVLASDLLRGERHLTEIQREIRQAEYARLLENRHERSKAKPRRKGGRRNRKPTRAARERMEGGEEHLTYKLGVKLARL